MRKSQSTLSFKDQEKAFEQQVLGSGGLIQYAYYAQFGYPGTPKPASDPAVSFPRKADESHTIFAGLG